MVTLNLSGAASLQLKEEEADYLQETISRSPFTRNALDSESTVSVAKNDRSEDQKALLELLAVLEEETEVATKTKMNSDYVPGMVTVLHGEHLEALGIHTVADALSMVPGIQMSRLGFGQPSLKIRGFEFPFNAGNIKVMLNSVALSRESSGINSSVLLTPVEQVDRIEVIRGPGSSVYGDFAMAGVANIITKKSGNKVFGGTGDDDFRGGGGYYSYQNEEKSLEVGLNLSMMDDRDSAAKINSNPDEERFTGIFNLNYKKFTLTAQGIRRDLEFDLSSLGSTPRRGDQMEESWAIEGRQCIELGQNADLEASLSLLHNNWNSDAPPSEFRGDRMQTGLDLNWSPRSGHQLLFGISYMKSDIDDALNQPPGKSPTVLSGIDRNNYSVSIQDQVELNDRCSLTLGVRFDDYDDVGTLFSPRVAAVYRLGEHHVIKAQYSEGFRAPTFFELYANGTVQESLDFEVIKTTEMAYVYRQPNRVARVTLYASDIDDGIFRSSEGYANMVKMESKGVEMEWEHQLSEKFRWLANVSYVDVWDGRSGQTAIGVADWLANLAFFWEPVPKLMAAGRLLYVGDRDASEKRVDGYERIDFTISRMDFLQKGLTLRFGIKNIFDDTVIYMINRANRLFEEEYTGRTCWFQVAYDF